MRRRDQRQVRRQRAMAAVTANSPAASADGVCDGRCSATASARCSGTCSGKCSATCTVKGQAECSGSCSGGCSVELKEPKCSGEVEAPEGQRRVQGELRRAGEREGRVPTRSRDGAADRNGGRPGRGQAEGGHRSQSAGSSRSRWRMRGKLERAAAGVQTSSRGSKRSSRAAGRPRSRSARVWLRRSRHRQRPACPSTSPCRPARARADRRARDDGRS